MTNPIARIHQSRTLSESQVGILLLTIYCTIILGGLAVFLFVLDLVLS